MYDDPDFDEFSLYDLQHEDDPVLLLDDAMLEGLALEGLDLDGYGMEPPELMLDVPYVPSDEKVVDALLDLAGVTSRDLLYDLGCGDGRIVVAAAMQRSARAVGIDLDPARIADAMEYAGNCRVERWVDFREGDLLEADFSNATVVTLYLLDSINLELRPRLQQELQPGTRIVSHAFDMGDWKPDEHVRLGGINLYKWIVPARLAGRWQWHSACGKAFAIELKQKHQKLSGTAQIDGQPAQLQRALLQGDLVELQISAPDTGKPYRFTIRYRDGELQPLDPAVQPAAATRITG